MTKVNGMYAFFDDMTWVIPSKRLDELGRIMRYGTPTKQDCLSIAFLVDCYFELVTCSVKKRKQVIKQLQKIMKKRTTDEGLEIIE